MTTVTVLFCKDTDETVILTAFVGEAGSPNPPPPHRVPPAAVEQKPGCAPVTAKLTLATAAPEELVAVEARVIFIPPSLALCPMPSVMLCREPIPTTKPISGAVKWYGALVAYIVPFEPYACAV